MTGICLISDVVPILGPFLWTAHGLLLSPLLRDLRKLSSVQHAL